MSMTMWNRSIIHAFKGLQHARALSTRAQPLSSQQKASSLPLRFTLELPHSQINDFGKILSELEAWSGIENQDGHNAAVVLASPELARTITNHSFMERLASLLSGTYRQDNFHMLGAAVDHIAPDVGSYQPIQGLSIMRGRLDDILPGLWEKKPPKVGDDANTAPALKFGLGQTMITVPGANTAFQNNHDFTLVASRIALTNGQEQTTEQRELESQIIRIPWAGDQKSIADLDLWTPLLPMTLPRAVTASFGNIIKGLGVNGASVPASTELEDAVERVFKNLPSLAESGPIGIWAVVIPKDIYEQSNAQPEFDAARDGEELITTTSRHIEKLYSQGARVYQILSGGGGWGAKKGLLSLDPQRTHFAPSEEESFMRFMGAMEASEFAPVGSYIQFFTPLRASTHHAEEKTCNNAVVLGVHDANVTARECTAAKIHHDMFGALSNVSIFTSDRSLEESKLSVPNSRICFHGGFEDKDPWPADLATDTALLMMPELFEEVVR